MNRFVRWPRRAARVIGTGSMVLIVLTFANLPEAAAAAPRAERGQLAAVEPFDSGQSRPAGPAPQGAGARTPRLIAESAPNLPPGDEIVTATADQNGYHLYAASSGSGWRWQPLATLQPGGYDEQRWIGEHCLTGDGRWVVAVVAPWPANNSDLGREQGGIAYAVNAHTGAVRPLAAGLALTYFNPGCAADGSVALTRYVGAGSEILVADPATGSVRSTGVVAAHLTSAVPARGAVYAARGMDVVQVDRTAARRVFSLPGQAFRLTANGQHGIDLLAMTGTREAAVWRWTGGATAVPVARGTVTRIRLFAGRGGHNQIVNAEWAMPGTGLRLDPSVRARVPERVSLDGNAVQIGADSTSSAIRLVRSSDGMSLAGAPPATVAHAVVTVPPAETSPGPAPTPAVQQPNTTTPTCAVARNDVNNQVLQPTPAKVEWAANLAGRGVLIGSGGAPLRPADAFNLGQSAYSPSDDFPLPTPFGAGGKAIPREILDGIFAQESNFSQATWHALPGLAGNPLIADYYGWVKTGHVDYDQADCGYGIGQITDLMRMDPTGQATGLQRKIAADYAENAAAAAQIVAQKWNQLAAAGIRYGSGDPALLENWYFALWAYNSGLNPQASTGNTTGCTPGPGCTDADGNWGLGWANNPANPDYDPQRHPFLHIAVDVEGIEVQVRTYDDASHPQDWPYQEKVFGWMESGQNGRDGSLEFQPTFDYDLQAGTLLNLPATTRFCTAGNHCTPDPLIGSGVCNRSDYHCWWHWPATELFAAAHGRATVADGTAEPYSPNPHPPVCGRAVSGLPANAIIVDDIDPGTNLAGCTHSDWTDGGRFLVSHGRLDDGNDIDWHQLGAGFGGHMWFTHTPVASNDWISIGQWIPTALLPGRYRVEAFVPDQGAWATEAAYWIYNGKGPKFRRLLDQAAFINQWADLGSYWLGPGAMVTLSNSAPDSLPNQDIAYDAIAFIPLAAPGGLAMLGDSFSAGQGSGPYDPDTYTATDSCHRSPYSWERVYAAGTTTYASGGWKHVACSGAIITDFRNPNHNWPVEPPQLNALTGNDGLVLLTVGGNDIGFSKIATDCIVWRQCKSKYVVNGVDTVLDSIQRLEPQLEQLYVQIVAEAPNAEVHVLTYPNMLTTDDRGLCASDGLLGLDDRIWLVGVTRALDDAVVTAANNVGVDALDVFDAFAGHELCAPDPWINGLASTSDRQEWFHPRAAGYAAEAARLKAVLQVP